jgi:methionine sulfoxide reductase heme-binding subunit
MAPPGVRTREEASTMPMPWRDRHGRFLPLKAAVLAAAFVPGLVYAFWWATDDLGPRSLNELIHGAGLWTVRSLLISLAITPFARMLNWPKLLTVRRMAGLTALAYGTIHLALYVTDQKFNLSVVVSEIVSRFYLTIGFIALLGLAALGVTSANTAVKRMGRWWKRLHRLAYPIGALALLHYFIQVKANVSEPVFVAGLYLWLMAWRALPDAWRRRVAIYPALAIVIAAATAGVEFAWYGVATRINPWRVLAANESIGYGLRPAHWVLVVTLAAALIIAARRFMVNRTGGVNRSGGGRVSGYRSSGPIPARTGYGS